MTRLCRLVSNQDDSGISASWNNYGILLAETGDWQNACVCLEKALELRRKIGDRSREAKFPRKPRTCQYTSSEFQAGNRMPGTSIDNPARDWRPPLCSLTPCIRSEIFIVSLTDLIPARKYLNEAIRIHRQAGNKVGEANI